MVQKIKKSEATKNKLLDSLWKLILKGEKNLSVQTITQKAGTAYGSFYRYFKNVDEMHRELIEKRVYALAEFAEESLGVIESPILRFYVGYYFALTMFRDKNVSAWVMKHPKFMNRTWHKFSEPTAEKFFLEAIEKKYSADFTKANLEHYRRVRKFVHWTYQEILSQHAEGRPEDQIFIDFMDSTNLLDLPKKVHRSYVQKAIKVVAKFDLPD